LISDDFWTCTLMLQKMNGSLQQEYKEDIIAEDNAEELIQQRFFSLNLVGSKQIVNATGKRD